MATRDIRGAYELLRRAMQQQYLLQQISDFSLAPKEIPGYDPNNDNDPQGGLPGRLFALQAEPGHRKLFESTGEASSPAQDSNFRMLSRIPTGNRSEDGLRADGPNSPGSGPTVQQYRMAGPTYSQCVDRCLHLLPSPSGDLQSSEFRKCVGKCMGRLL